MPGFKIEIAGINKFRDRLENAIIQSAAEKLYNSIQEKVPEIEMEKISITFNSVGKNLILDTTNLTTTLRDKIERCGLATARYIAGLYPMY